MPTPIENVFANLQAYKRKYYKNMLIKGSILAVCALITAFAVVNMLEYFGNFSTTLRASLFYGFLALSLTSLLYWVLIPIYRLIDLRRQLSDVEAAKNIGSHFPEIDDRLLNVLQLHGQSADFDRNALWQASVNQKAAQIAPIPFTRAIDYKKNRKYVRFLIFPLFIVGALLLIDIDLFKVSTERLINYNESYAPQAPFSFELKNQTLEAFRNEDFTLEAHLKGKALPKDVFIYLPSGRKIKMEKQADGLYTYTFNKIQKQIDFALEGEGYLSKNYTILLRERPHISQFQMLLEYPAYIGKKNERVENTGNALIPAGTRVKWLFQTKETEQITFVFESDSLPQAAKEVGEAVFEYDKKALTSTAYHIKLKNQYSQNKEEIKYFLNVIPDEYPQISLTEFEDTLMYDYIALGGAVSDDYGISKIALHYRISDPNAPNQQAKFQTLPIAHNKNAISQQYFYQLELQKLGLKAGQQIEYFTEVWDNDGIRGSKSSRSATFRFALPSSRELKQEAEQAASQAEAQMNEALKEAEILQEKLKEMQDRLKGKKELSWQDKKALEELLKKHEELSKKIDKMSQENDLLNEKEERAGQKKNERVAEKAEQLQKLMDEMLDEETKKLYEKLNELLQENAKSEDLKELLEQIEKKQLNVEKELDRALEMFKQLQMDKKMEDIAQQLEDLAQKQEQLAEETKKLDEKQAAKSDPKQEDKQNQAFQEQKEKQDNLNQEFEQLEKEMEELKEMNEELQNERDLDDLDQNQEQIEQEQQKSSQELGKQNKQKAAQSQKNAAQEMKKMAQEMQQMAQSMEMQAMQQDYGDLRAILENLLKLSFDQEAIMEGFRNLSPSDPQFNVLSQKQLKLVDDAKIVEDSLRALAKKSFQIESFVMRELTDMNDYIEQSLKSIQDRRADIAAGKQQRTMTSINNLALMLSDVLEQMQQMMSMGMPGQQMCSMPGNKPSLGQMQQSLNQRIQQLQKSGKSGRALSEELSKLAAEQEAIRRAVQEQMKAGGKQKGNQGDPNNPDGEEGEENDDKEGGSKGNGTMGELLEQMEKTEEDLVNKRITQELIERQKEIMTRLLESEKAQKERELDKEREAEQAKTKKRVPPNDNFSDYLKEKEKQIELLKTIPPALHPYYKQYVNQYFKKL
ncbi:DUF4175 family protein [Hugenholtzia roseola]|uniref:DUF4175 family protein n=1 Tax=Hugenholtzia roseola TaxID=1002 RepID=UPI00047D998E|nr:DUF4175 family protein [Hugenholtzia roseola]